MPAARLQTISGQDMIIQDFSKRLLGLICLDGLLSLSYSGKFHTFCSLLTSDCGNCTSTGFFFRSSHRKTSSIFTASIAVHPEVPFVGPSQMCKKMHEPQPASCFAL